MARNLERKREYDRLRYAKLREEDPIGVRENERARKAAQRKRKRDPHSEFNTISLDTIQGRSLIDRQSFTDWSQSDAVN